MAMTRMRYQANYLSNWKPGRRLRIQPAQISLLTGYFEDDPDWSFERKLEIAGLTGLSTAQVKKWNFDEKKRRGMETNSRKSRSSK